MPDSAENESSPMSQSLRNLREDTRKVLERVKANRDRIERFRSETEFLPKSAVKKKVVGDEGLEPPTNCV